MNSEAALAKAVANQPISVAICASPALQFYTGGAWAALADSVSGAGWPLEAECVSHAPMQACSVKSVCACWGTGVFGGASCTGLNHGVLAVGLGEVRVLPLLHIPQTVG